MWESPWSNVKKKHRGLNTYPKPFSKIIEGIADATRTYPQSTYAPRKQTTHVIYAKQDLLRSRKRAKHHVLRFNRPFAASVRHDRIGKVAR